MKKIIPLLFLLFISNYLIAQESCSDEIVMAVKGKWTKQPDVTMPAGQAQVISRIDKMQQLLQTAFSELKGIEARWYRSMGGYYPAVYNNSVSYELNALFKTYYCNL